MSDLSDKVELLLGEALPSHRVVKEKYVNYRQSKLYFDFYLPELNLYIEVQGDQHFRFNKFFHVDGMAFTNQKFRDALKREFIDSNNYKMVALTEKQIKTLDKDSLRTIIIETL